MILWYLEPGQRIRADVIEDGEVVYSTTHPFPPAGSQALFWMVIRALAQEIKSEVRNDH